MIANIQQESYTYGSGIIKKPTEEEMSHEFCKCHGHLGIRHSNKDISRQIEHVGPKKLAPLPPTTSTPAEAIDVNKNISQIKKWLVIAAKVAIVAVAFAALITLGVYTFGAAPAIAAAIGGTAALGAVHGVAIGIFISAVATPFVGLLTDMYKFTQHNLKDVLLFSGFEISVVISSTFGGLIFGLL